MLYITRTRAMLGPVLLFAALTAVAPGAGLERIKYNHSGLVVDLGVGLWAAPLPMDYDGDGDYDLVVSCSDKPYNGTWFFENATGDVAYPVFKPAVKIGRAHRNIQPSYVGGEVRLLIPGRELADFRRFGFERTVGIYPEDDIHGGKTRANQWKYCDYNGDGLLDLLVGAGDWEAYGWDDAYDDRGRWTHGPLHGYVYLIVNQGSPDSPAYAAPRRLRAGGEVLDVYGLPSPNLADFDGDGDLDLVCGEFLDKFTYFENVGTRANPKYASGRKLANGGRAVTMDLQMIVPVALDWDKDGDVDLVVGQEDGRVALVENTGNLEDGLPRFLPPKFFRQEAHEVKFGALVTPCGVDWDGDGDDDLICGNTAGYIGFIENLDGGNPPKWAEPVYLKAADEVIRIQAGDNGSIQGPAEAKWGYTTLTVADWNHDGLLDIVVNSIWGKVVWYRNVGSRHSPQLAAARPVEVAWPGKAPKPAWTWWEPGTKELAPQWRTTPVVIDLNDDGLNDLVMLDHEGYLALFPRVRAGGQLRLLPGQRVFVDTDRQALQLNSNRAGKSGRRKLCFADWDGDGIQDLLANGKNIRFLRGLSVDRGRYVFQDQGEVDSRLLAGHTTSPTVVDWDRNGVPDLLVGAEDGYLYYLQNPHRDGSDRVEP